MRIHRRSAGSLLTIQLSFEDYGNRKRSESGTHAARTAASLRHPRAAESGRPVRKAARHRLAEDALVLYRVGARPGPRGHVAQARILTNRRSTRAGLRESRKTRREPEFLVRRCAPPINGIAAPP